MGGILALHLGHGFAAELVAAFVFGVSGVAFDPVPLDLMAGGGGVEGSPEVLVFHGLFGGSFPAVFLPAREPFGDAVADILRVGVQIDGAGFGQHGEGFDGGA